MPPKTTSERVQALRKRRGALGLTRLELWAHPDDHQPIKRYAAAKAGKRQQEKSK